MSHVWLKRSILLTSLVLTFQAVSAHADVRRFRYQLWTMSGDPQYAGEIKQPGPLKGRICVIETDDQGRITKATEIINGKETDELRFTFSGKQKLPSGYDEFVAGEHIGSNRIQRNEKGEISREELFTVKGELTFYTLYLYQPDYVEVVTHTADGTVKERYLLYFSEKGFRVREVRYPGLGSTHYDSELDENTGLTKSRKKFVNEQLVSATEFRHDDNGSLLREDLYSSKGVLYGWFEYKDGLLMTKNYKFASGQTRQSRITYRDNGWSKSAKYFVNEKEICTFEYERLSDGTIKRTVALGPDGEVWAEYPAMAVNEVQKNGQPYDQPNGIIYKKGDWW
jgi:hypothetical protein